MHTRRPVAGTSLVALCVLQVACERGPQVTTQPVRTTADVPGAFGDSVVDVLGSRVILPSTASAGNTAGAALEQSIQATSGLALVLVKSASAARIAEARGTRAPIPAGAARAALESLTARNDVQVLNYYRWLGIAYVRLAPGAASDLRGRVYADVVEPARKVRSAEDATQGAVRAAGAAPPRAVLSGTQVTPWNVSLVHAPDAWTISTGSNAKVMFMFRGLYASDPDFPNVPAGNCGGYPHACGGAAYTNGNTQFSIVVPQDNSFGIVGVAPGVQGTNIFPWNPYSFQSDTGSTIDLNFVVAGLNTAIQNGVRVILTDIPHNGQDAGEAAAFAQAWAHNAISVAAVLGSGQYETNVYPSAYPNVITASGVDPNGQFAGAGACRYWQTGSNYGPNVSLAAPISGWVTLYGGGYYLDLWGGIVGGHECSPILSAAHVAGAASLVTSLHPTWSATQVTQALLASASGGGTRINDYYGYGLVNAAAAVQYVPPPPSISVSITGPNLVPAHHYCTWSAGAWGGAEPYTYSWTVNGSPAGDGSDVLNITTPRSAFTIAVSATDANGLYAWTSVSVSIGGTGCAAQ